MFKVQHSFVGYLQARRDDAIDTISIRLFFFVTRRAPLRFLMGFHKELLAEIKRRIVEECNEAEEGQSDPATVAC
jgi:hypothetical protein